MGGPLSKGCCGAELRRLAQDNRLNAQLFDIRVSTGVILQVMDGETSHLALCLARAADLGERAKGNPDAASKAELLRLQQQWLDVAERYKVAQAARLYLERTRQGQLAAINSALLTTLRE
jgi:hypothetical protein